MVYPIFYYIYARQRNIGFWTAVLRSPKMCLFFQLVILLPQLYWFNVMIKGALKVIQENKKPKAISDKKSE